MRGAEVRTVSVSGVQVFRKDGISCEGKNEHAGGNQAALLQRSLQGRGGGRPDL